VESAGDSDLLTSNIILTGPNASDFQLALTGTVGRDCVGTSLGPGTLCDLDVTFSPAATATGTRTASLIFTDGAADSPQTVSLRFARDLRPNDFKTGNVVLLGASSADPWVELFEPRMNFVLGDDYRTLYGVINRSPQKGEPARWESKRDDPQQRVFAVVAYLSNLAGDGNALIIEGTTVAGTEAATDFVNDDTRLLPFLNRIKRSDGSLPHFELLLEAHSMSASAVQSQILAWRTTN
jgi:hypothetical protein